MFGMPGVKNHYPDLNNHLMNRNGRDRAVSQAVSNFDLFQLDGNNQPNMQIERVTVERARWMRLSTVIDGVRYYEIKTVIRSFGASQIH